MTATALSPPASFVSVTKDEFFAAIGQLNVHPRADVATLRDPHIVSHWEMPNRDRIGFSGSNDGGYWLRPDLAKAVQS